MNNDFTIILAGYSGSISGGDEHVLQLIQHLSTSGIPTRVLLPKDAYHHRIPDSIERLDIPLLPLEPALRKNNISLLVVYLWRILYSHFVLRKIAKQSSQISSKFICASHLFHDVFPLFTLGKKQSEFVYAYHLIRFCGSRHGLSKKISTLLEALSLSIARRRHCKVLTSSDVVESQLVDAIGIDADNITMTANGVDVSLIKQIPDQEKRYDLVFCGRFVPHKGILDLLQAFRSLSTSRLMTLCLIGNGPQLPEIKDYIEEHQLSGVDIVTDANDEQKFILLKSSRLFVLPSSEEGWGIVIGEALACGINVLAYHIDEIYAIWSDSITWVESGHVDQLSSAINTILEHEDIQYPDAGLWLQSQDWDNIIKLELDFFNQ